MSLLLALQEGAVHLSLTCSSGIYSLSGGDSSLRWMIDASTITSGILPDKILELETGRFVKIISDKVGFLL